MTINTECPICLISQEQNSERLFPLSCCHSVHLSCAKNMIKAECPLCREKIINLPKDIINNIIENGKQYRNEIEEQELQSLREVFEETNPTLSPNFQVFLAYGRLRDMGIPHHLIPSQIEIEYDTESPAPPGYAIYQALIDSVLENINDYIEENDFSDDDTPRTERRYSSYDEETDDEDKLFIKEGADIRRRYITQGLNVSFHLSDIPPVDVEELGLPC